MMIRAITSLSTLLVLSLGFTACGDDKGTTTDSTTNTTPMTTGDSETGTSGLPPSTGTTADTVDTVEPTTTEPGTTTTEPGTTTTDPSTTGTTTSPGTTGTTTDPGTTTGGGAALYGPCDAMGMCPEDQDCLMVMGIEGNFCSAKCDAMTKCPAADVAAMPNCALTMGMAMEPTNCVLVCPPGDDTACPQGMTCKAVPMQVGVGVCTAP
jgi:hypothetical protein